MSREAERQRWLMASLVGPVAPVQSDMPPSGWLQPRRATEAGMAAYRRHAAATAERALAAAYPTVQQLLGNVSFAALAREAWQRHPPTAGDLALWDGGLVASIAAAETLAPEPYLADVAALDWAVHEAGMAADSTAATGLERLGSHDPQQLWVQLAAGTALVTSTWPVASIWLAHRRTDDARFDAVRVALADQVGEVALVQRRGLRVQVAPVDSGTARFTAALLDGRALAMALETADEGFDFTAWLLQGLLQSVRGSIGPTPGA